MKDLEKLLMKKKDNGKLSEDEAQAKMDVLMELLEMAQGAMGSKVKNGMDGLKKVSVMAPDKEGLEEGLEKAQDLMEKPEIEEMVDSEEKSESPEMEAKEEALSKMLADDEDEDSIFNMKAKKKPMLDDEE